MESFASGQQLFIFFPLMCMFLSFLIALKSRLINPGAVNCNIASVILGEELGGKQRMVYIWSDAESADELKHKLLCINFELETEKMMAKEELAKNEETIKQLFQLLKVACQERDEARSQLHKLVNELTPSISADLTTPDLLPQLNSIDSPITPKPTNPPIFKEPDFLAPQAQNFHAYGSYPNQNFGSMSFQGHPNPNFVDSNNIGFSKKPVVEECVDSSIDFGTVLIENIARTRPLPKQGRLREAVMDTPPLLQTLLVAPLPKWRNPPPLPFFKNPPSLVYGGDCGAPVEHNEAVDLIRVAQNSFLESSPGCSQMPSSSVLNFARGSACLNNGMEYADAMQYQIASVKRMRL